MTKPDTAAPPPRTEAQRLAVLDGMRGVAALMVLIYHYSARWTVAEHGHSLYPHGDAILNAVPGFIFFGEIGVRLFFLISGFVIILTLKRCTGILDFLTRRAARLWPVMLVCATLTTLLVNGSGIHERLEGTSYWHVEPVEYLLSIFFVEPVIITTFFDFQGIGWVDGVYWTLGAEVRFYALIGISFWLLSGRRFLWAWCIFQAVSSLHDPLRAISGSGLPLPLTLLFQPGTLAFFTLGMAGYYYWQKQLNTPILLATALAAFDVVTGRLIPLEWGTGNSLLVCFAVEICIFAPFILFLLGSKFLSPFKSPAVVALGLASYPLYMFHDRVGMVAMTYLNDWGVSPYLALASTTGLVIGAAIILSKCVEYPGKRILLRLWRPISDRIQAKYSVLRFKASSPSRSSREADATNQT